MLDRRLLATLALLAAAAGCNPSSPDAGSTTTTDEATASTPTTEPPAEPIWSDEFDGAADALPDPAKWGYQVGGFGWGNNELQCYTQAPGNVSTDGQGHLRITAIKQPGHRCVDEHVNDYTSARITTQDRFSTTHGRLEIRAKVPAGVGTWSAFWALGTDYPKVDWPRSGEIDVMEQMGQHPNDVLGSVHGPTAAGDRWYLTRTSTRDAPLSADFHVYAAEWTSDAITYFLDGEQYGQITRADAEREGEWVFDKPFYLLLNQAIGGDLGGDVPATTTWPQTYLIDYVRVYR